MNSNPSQKSKRKYAFLFSVLTFVIYSYTNIQAQQTISISGTVTDMETGDPLPYASISVKGTYLGIISSSKGTFHLYLPDSLLNDTLEISFISYYSFSEAIHKLYNNPQEIKLKPHINTIAEVTVLPLTPEQTVRKMLANIKENYPQNTFLTEGFYHEEFKENGEYCDFSEAYVQIYSSKKNDSLISSARLIEGKTKNDITGRVNFFNDVYNNIKIRYGRYLEEEDESLDSLFDELRIINMGGPQSILTKPYGFDFLAFDTTNFHKLRFKQLKTTTLNGKDLYVIECKSKRPVEFTEMNALLYIDKVSFALVKYHEKSFIEIPAIYKPLLKLMFKLEMENLYGEYNIEFFEVNKTWYLKKIISKSMMDASLKQKGSKKKSYNIKIGRAFATTDVRKTNQQNFNPEDVLNDEPLRDQIKAYNSDFWENRTVIE